MFLAGLISHKSTQYMDFVETFNISLVLSTIYFSHFCGCRASFVFSCHSILECCNLFPGVKLSIKPFCFNFLSVWDFFKIKGQKHCF